MFITVTHCSLQRVKRYAQGHRRIGAWLGHCPSALSKGSTGSGGAFS